MAPEVTILSGVGGVSTFFSWLGVGVPLLASALAFLGVVLSLRKNSALATEQRKLALKQKAFSLGAGDILRVVNSLGWILHRRDPGDIGAEFAIATKSVGRLLVAASDETLRDLTRLMTRLTVAYAKLSGRRLHLEGDETLDDSARFRRLLRAWFVELRGIQPLWASVLGGMRRELGLDFDLPAFKATQKENRRQVVTALIKSFNLN